MTRHTFEEKLDIVFQVQIGKPIHRISCDLHIHERMILEWVRKYELYGEEALRRQPNIKATSEFKEEVVRLIIDKGISLSEVVLHYGVSRTALEGWVRLVRSSSYAALYHQSKQGRPSKTMGRPKKREPETELEKLQAENIRLKAENALLKKVKALVEERKARERTIGLPPSKN